MSDNTLLGDIVPPSPRTYARHAVLDEQGAIVPIGPQSIELDVWRYVLDAQSRKPTGMVRRDHMRTLGEVFADLEKAIDVEVCDRCGAERPKPQNGPYCEEHKGCGGEFGWFIDEYFNGPDKRDDPVPQNYRWIACYAVTGGSEGHYIHVDFLVPLAEVRVHPQEPNGWSSSIKANLAPSEHNAWRMVRLALGKTFKGMDHACKIAERCAILLGA